MKNVNFYFIILVLPQFIYSLKGSIASPLLFSNRPEDAQLNFVELARKYGMQVEEYEVVTEDGYVLTLFHILPNEGLLDALPVLLMHGITDSADSFIIRGNTSLSVTLATEGYDVWVGNNRGNKYTRKHAYLDPDKPEFWNYSVHEMGIYDLPAIIHYVLKKTGHKKLNAIGYSLGNTEFFVLGAEKPQYNNKINLMIAMSPIAYLHELGPFIEKLVASVPTLNAFLNITGQEELVNNDTKVLLNIICSQGRISYDICLRGFLFQITGEDSEEIEPSFAAVAVEHYPQPVSRKTLLHLVQIITNKRFMKFDYGAKDNLSKYGSILAPDYKLRDVTMKVALMYAANDGLSSVNNVERLKKSLPNVVEQRVIRRAKWNHIDWIWARHMHKYLYPILLPMLRKYSNG